MIASGSLVVETVSVAGGVVMPFAASTVPTDCAPPTGVVVYSTNYVAGSPAMWLETPWNDFYITREHRMG